MVNSQLERINLLVQDPDFITLCASRQIPDFNLFSLLGLEFDEITYSRILHWLLNPLGTHNLEDKFLRDFLKKIHFLNSNYFQDRKIDYITIDCIPLTQVIITKEQTILSKKRIDIFVKIQSDNEKWILIIENKIKSTESPDQTKFYAEELNNKFLDDYKKICIFLTPNGTKATDPNFISMKWSDIKAIIDNLIENAYLNQEILFFLKDFTKIIELNLMEGQDPETEQLIGRIHEKYGEVIQYLNEQFEYYNLDEPSILTKLGNSLKKELDAHYHESWIFDSGNNSCLFYKESWKKKWEMKKLNDKSSYRIAYFYIGIRGSRLIIALHNYSKNHVRERFTNALKKVCENDPTVLTKLNLDLNRKIGFSYKVFVEDINQIKENEIIELAKKELIFHIDIIGKFIDNALDLM